MEIANLFGAWFSSVYEKPIVFNNSVLDNITDCIDLNITDISISEVFDALASLKCELSSGPDLIPPIFLNNCRWSLAKPIHYLFLLSLKTGNFPLAWKTCFITPVWKSGDRSSVTNYRPISKLNTIPKLFEKILELKLTSSFSQILVNEQHGFRRAKSTITNTMLFYTHLVETVTSGGQIDVIYTDLHKAFDKVDHQLLLGKLRKLGLRPIIILVLFLFKRSFTTGEN